MERFKEDRKLVDQATDTNQLNLLRMIESRIVEIVQIEEDVKKKFPRLFQQRLPRFMRRRAASHNPHRIPRWLRSTKIVSKDRRKLYQYRRRIQFKKHKRILSRHARHKFKDPNKTLLHKWFAKRFKMYKTKPPRQPGLEFVPMHNNTKNFRNLTRQTRFGCAYISLAHLVAFKIDTQAIIDMNIIDVLNQLTTSVSGFTFAAQALEDFHYELVIHLYRTTSQEISDKGPQPTRATREHLCPAFVSQSETSLTLWAPRAQADQVAELFDSKRLPFVRIPPRDAMRVRLVGPEARSEAMRLVEDASKKEEHERAIEDVDLRLMPSRKFGLTIGRHIPGKTVSFTYYQTNPLSVDLVFGNKREGRMLWHKLVKNKAHLVGGKRDVEELLEKTYRESFSLKPDCD